MGTLFVDQRYDNSFYMSHNNSLFIVQVNVGTDDRYIVSLFVDQRYDTSFYHVT